MDQIAADRVGMTLKDYRLLIRDEYWIDGFEAVKDQMADRKVLLKCSKEMLKSRDVVKVRGFLGSAALTFSKCPLLTAPIGVGYNFKTKNVKSQRAFRRFVEDYYKRRKLYVDKYITTNKFLNYVK